MKNFSNNRKTTKYKKDNYDNEGAFARSYVGLKKSRKNRRIQRIDLCIAGVNNQNIHECECKDCEEKFMNLASE